MKINPSFRPTDQNIQFPDLSHNHTVQQKPFADMLREQDAQFAQGEISKILEQIGLQADRLARSMTIRELRQYKLLIKRFLEETARRGIVLKDTQGWDRRGRTKRYKLLEEIDEALLSMADELLESEQGRIVLLTKIGDIKGMLINYFY